MPCMFYSNRSNISLSERCNAFSLVLSVKHIPWAQTQMRSLFFFGWFMVPASSRVACVQQMHARMTHVIHLIHGAHVMLHAFFALGTMNSYNHIRKLRNSFSGNFIDVIIAAARLEHPCGAWSWTLRLCSGGCSCSAFHTA